MENKKIYNILSYIGPLFLVALFVPEKNDPSVKHHCGQGMLLFLIDFALGILATIITYVLGLVSLSLAATIGGILSSVLGVAAFVFMILGIINAATDKDADLPVIGKFAFYK